MEVADIDEVNLMASPLTGYARSIIDKINLVNKVVLPPENRRSFYLHGETDGVFIFRDDKITEIKKPQEVSIKTHSQGNLNIASSSELVNNNMLFEVKL